MPPEIVRLTGLTDTGVAAQVIAHHAACDRRFVGPRLPVSRDERWGCSMRDVPWAAQDITGIKLEFLLYRHCEFCYDPQRADSIHKRRRPGCQVAAGPSFT